MNYSTVGDQANGSKCIPFVSEYSDCTDANSCSGCNRCVCSAEGEWRCETVFDCAVDDDDTDRETFSTALDVLYSELKNKAKKKHRSFVPPPPKPDDELIVPDDNLYEEDFSTYLSRQKRSAQENVEINKNENHTLNFFHTTDDTLKDTNKSGTIAARQVDMERLPKLSRRSGLLDNYNKSDLSALHIEYNPQEYDHHIAENKIEPVPPTEDLDLSKSELHKLMGNYTQSMKNEELSQLVVNELKRGTEVIGDKNVPPMSNITFVSENDTLTAMTFIAGNLLNKLWDMEKDSSESIEVGTLKHKKINDLLELFKEPLSIRQETFLKNALLKLSDTLNKNKNVKNVSLCETITDSDILSSDGLNESDSKREKNNKTNCDKEKIKNEQEKDNKKEMNSDVIHKLNNVISLMQRYEKVQKSLGDLKQPSLSTSAYKTNVDDFLSIGENSSINLFGSLLDRITELLIPSNASKKSTNKLKRLNQFSTNDNKKLLENKFNIDFSQNNITIKDKIIFDYLNHIENNPNCLLRRHGNKKKETNINIEGNILYNLSEFFKIKSLIDLFKLTKPEKVNEETVTITESYRQVTPSSDILRKPANKVISNEPQKLNITKEKLKNHLRALIDDLLELQNENDPKSKSNINILDALPCIFNILNADKLNNDKLSRKNLIKSESLNKIKTLIDSLKLEFTSTIPTRRNNLITAERAKTAKVWERILRNVNKQKETRRNFNYNVPKTYEELKALIEGVDSASNSYKNFALLSVVPPHKRLMLLKTLEADTKQKTLAIKHIINSVDTINKLPLDKQNEFKEFIDNAENNINLSIKVLQNLGKPKHINEKQMVEIFDPTKYEGKKQVPKSVIVPEFGANYKSNNIKLTRNQIVSQLIENRIKVYLASREATNDDLSDDINYNVGKRILLLLQQGNIDVAKELFKVFEATKRENRENIDDAGNNAKQKGPLLLALKEPLIRIEASSKKMSMKSPELLFKQLLNLKNLNIK